MSTFLSSKFRERHTPFRVAAAHTVSQPATSRKWTPTHTVPESVVGGASKSGFSSSTGTLCALRSGAPSCPRIGSGMTLVVSVPHSGVSASSLAYGSVGVAAGATSVKDGTVKELELPAGAENAAGASEMRARMRPRACEVRMVGWTGKSNTRVEKRQMSVGHRVSRWWLLYLARRHRVAFPAAARRLAYARRARRIQSASTSGCTAAPAQRDEATSSVSKYILFVQVYPGLRERLPFCSRKAVSRCM
jgi:hypothetical protein